MSRKILILVLLLSLFCTIGIREMFEKADLNDRARQGIDNSAYRQEFFAPDMRKNKDFLSDECRIFLNKVEKTACIFRFHLPHLTIPLLFPMKIRGWQSAAIRRQICTKGQILWLPEMKEVFIPL